VPKKKSQQDVIMDVHTDAGMGAQEIVREVAKVVVRLDVVDIVLVVVKVHALLDVVDNVEVIAVEIVKRVAITNAIGVVKHLAPILVTPFVRDT
jgi:hypothetical protein